MTEEDGGKAGQCSYQGTSIEVNVISISVPSSPSVSYWNHFNKRSGGRLKKFLLRRSICNWQSGEGCYFHPFARYCVLNYIHPVVESVQNIDQDAASCNPAKQRQHQTPGVINKVRQGSSSTIYLLKLLTATITHCHLARAKARTGEVRAVLAGC